MNFQVVTLCGSTKFKDEFMNVARNLTFAGNIVLNLGAFIKADGLKIDAHQKQLLMSMQKQKIDMSESIVVINVGRYVGESTKEEIEYARKQGKKILYIEKPYTRVSYKKFVNGLELYCEVSKKN